MNIQSCCTTLIQEGVSFNLVGVVLNAEFISASLFKLLLKLSKIIKTVCHARESGHPLCKDKRKTDSHFRGNDNSAMITIDTTSKIYFRRIIFLISVKLPARN